jgi:aspartate/tyrosine/aromatic aminotransferase
MEFFNLMSFMSFFQNIPLLPDDPIFGLRSLFAADPRPDKINLAVGSYKTAEGHPLILNTVKEAEQRILRQGLNKEYLPIEGDKEFIQLAVALLFGLDSVLFQSQSFFAAQTVGGTSALRIAAEFLVKLVTPQIFIPQFSWSNHRQVFERAGLLVDTYPYFNFQTYSLDEQGMYQAIEKMPSGSAILLQASCHNPTGVDPTLDQWKELSALIKKKRLLPLFDVAYQGFGDGLEEDVQAVRYFVQENHEMLVAYSFSKNFGLYGERVGFLTVISSQLESVRHIASQLRVLIRSDYSNPPLQGERIVSTILNSKELTSVWKTEVNDMSSRIKEIRQALIATLFAYGTHHHFEALGKQKGFFSFIGLSSEQVQRLRNEKGIYMPMNGRLSLAGINMKNLSYVAEALLSVMK